MTLRSLVKEPKLTGALLIFAMSLGLAVVDAVFQVRAVLSAISKAV